MIQGLTQPVGAPELTVEALAILRALRRSNGYFLEINRSLSYEITAETFHVVLIDGKQVVCVDTASKFSPPLYLTLMMSSHKLVRLSGEHFQDAADHERIATLKIT